jgi:hypothetical protein
VIVCIIDINYGTRLTLGCGVASRWRAEQGHCGLWKKWVGKRVVVASVMQLTTELGLL